MKIPLALTTLMFASTLYAAENYDLSLTLGAHDHYSGQETVTVTAKRALAAKFKFAGGQITSATINGEIAQVKSKTDLMELTGAKLKVGANTITIAFDHPYAAGDASGLHQWKDQKDGATYIYSQIQGDQNQSAFPVFETSSDASLKVKIDGPKEWASSIDDEIFKQFALYAGPFKVADFKSAAGTPVRVLVPASTA